MVTAGRNRIFRHRRLSWDRARWAGAAGTGSAARPPAASTAAPAAAASPAAGAHPLAVRTLVVRTLHDAGPASLRAAITVANGSGPHSATRIVFAVRGTIRLARALPAIHRRVAIDATSA